MDIAFYMCPLFMPLGLKNNILDSFTQGKEHKKTVIFSNICYQAGACFSAGILTWDATKKFMIAKMAPKAKTY